MKNGKSYAITLQTNLKLVEELLNSPNIIKNGVKILKLNFQRPKIRGIFAQMSVRCFSDTILRQIKQG